MLTSELMDNLKAYAPDAFAALWRGSLSEERRGAFIEAIDVLYLSRAGDTLFTGVDRHIKLARYVGSESGWARVNRLANWIYRRGTWGKAEADRLERARLAKLHALETQMEACRRTMTQQGRSMDHWVDARNDAKAALAKAEAEVIRVRDSLRETESTMRDLAREIQALGPVAPEMVA